MASQSNERYLGEPVFGVTYEGRVRRTAISKLSIPRHAKKKGNDIAAIMKRMLDRDAYSLLDGDGLTATFFSLDAAIAKAEKILKARLMSSDITKAQEESARKYLKSLGTKAGRAAILSQSLVDRVEIPLLNKDRRLGKSERFPTEYFRPGERVYGIVTPDAHHSVSPGWRPHPYFVLVTKVETVCYSPRWPGKVYYRLVDTHYSIQHPRLCATKEEARQKMAAIFAKETGGVLDPQKVMFINVSVEKAAHDKTMKAIMKSVNSRPMY